MATVYRHSFTRLTASEQSDEEFCLNIVFIHGLRGHPRQTWEASASASTSSSSDVTKKSKSLVSLFRRRKAVPVVTDTEQAQESFSGSASPLSIPSTVFWPEDYLALDIPQARVWTYGYNADVIGGLFQANNKNSISQHGRDLSVRLEREVDNGKPIAFVVHSLGGIVLKDAIRRSAMARDRTKLVVFLGTPHRGSAYAGWGQIASNLARLALQDSNKRLLETLEVNSEVLDNIHDEFKTITFKGTIKIHSFQESRGITGMRGLEEKVVDDFSSKLDLPRELETVESIDANHMQMARCSSRDDQIYRAISGVLKVFVREEVESQQNLPTSATSNQFSMVSNAGIGSLQQPPGSARPQYTYNDFPIGVICALAVEKAAFVAMLDEMYETLPTPTGDGNSYTFGRIGDHNIVAACLPAGMTGNNSAAMVAKDMLRSFPIKIGLMVGIGGGVWSATVDIRLGDVVVSQPDGIHGGVVQWDFGKMESGGFKRTGSLNKPPRPLLNALQDIKTKHMTEGDRLAEHLSKMVQNKPRMAPNFLYQGTEHDYLYEPSYNHVGGEMCAGCDTRKTVERPRRTTTGPHIHYGNIASGNEVIKNSQFRDHIARKEGVICFEMEAAGLMDNFPCLVIRGICDYADSHKNKRWQPYAAAAAAAYAKELLEIVQKQGVHELEPAST